MTVRPLRIVLVVGSLRVGGTEKQVARLASELQWRGHLVRVVALGESGPLAAVLEPGGVDTRVLGYQGLVRHDDAGRLRPWLALIELSKLRGLYSAVRRPRADVCHSNLFWANVFAMPLAALAGVPVRVTGRRALVQPAERRRWARALLGSAEWFATARVANSRAVASDWHALDCRRGAARVIPNGVDIPDRAADVAADPPVGVVVANFIAYKGHADVVDALALLHDPPVIRLVGDGPERERVEARAAAAGVAGRLEFVGAVADPRPYYQAAQFAVLASWTEGLPNALLEAMAAGLPVIATDVGGARELVVDNLSGLLVPPRDPAALAAAIAAIASSPARRREMGALARRIAERFSWDRCVEEHLALYGVPHGRP